MIGQTTIWEPPAVVSRDQALQLHRDVMAMPSGPIRIREDIFRLHELELDWDIGVVIYEPQDAGRIPHGPDGKKVGIYCCCTVVSPISNRSSASVNCCRRSSA